MENINRREFIKKTLLTGIAMGSGIVSAQTHIKGEIPLRNLGKTGKKVSSICLGGWDIGNLAKKDEKEAIYIMQDAINRGLTFFDNCWDYHKGYSEEVMGKALSESGIREKAFLMTEVCARDYTRAKEQLDQSLNRLKTDYLDLWQFHAIKWDDDPDLIFNEERGALKAALEAKKEGKILHIGFTGHKAPKHHLKMLEKNFDWDVVQMPTSILDYHYDSFQHQVMPRLNERNIGILGMKALGGNPGKIPVQLPVSAEIARRFALSLPISSLVCGIQSRKDLNQDINIATNFNPLSEDEIDEVLETSVAFAKNGKIEAYKTGNYGCDWHHKNPV